MIPALHRNFIDNALDYFKRDSRIEGIAAGGSYITGEMDDYSDVDFVVVVNPNSYDEVMNERKRIAAGLGNLLSAFTGEHVGETRLLICLYGPPLLHVDLKFVSLDDVAHRVEDPFILWERERIVSEKLKEENANFPYPDMQWIEDRFWIWIHYAGTKLGRNELFETIEFISYLRQFVIGPLLLMKNNKLPRGVRKIEIDAPEDIEKLRLTVAEHDKQSCINAVKILIDFYIQLREKFEPDGFTKHTEAQKYAIEYLLSMEEREIIKRYDALKTIAEKALSQYDLEIKTVEFLTEETNVYFKVETKDGTRYALKIYHEGSSTYEDNKAEIYFISRLKDINTPGILLNKEGEGITLVKEDNDAVPFRTALYTWLEGKELYGNESMELFKKLGKQTALLHQQTVGWDIPEDILTKKWDKVFYYTDEKAVYMNPEYKHIINNNDCEMLDKLVPVLNKKLSAVYTDRKPQLLHGDLNPWNVKFENEGLKIFDFEDAVLGYPIHELAIILYFYRHAKGINYDEIKRSLIEGYRNVFPEADFSDELIEMLILAREITFMNYSLLYDEEPKEYATVCLNRIRDFLSDSSITDL